MTARHWSDSAEVMGGLGGECNEDGGRLMNSTDINGRVGSGDASFWGGSDLKAMSIRREIAPMLRLALPLVMAEVGWMSMGVVDTVMVGHLPRPAVTISAVALGQVLYN